jgi:hypothetical protein
MVVAKREVGRVAPQTHVCGVAEGVLPAKRVLRESRLGSNRSDATPIYGGILKTTARCGGTIEEQFISLCGGTGRNIPLERGRCVTPLRRQTRDEPGAIYCAPTRTYDNALDC